MEEFLKVGVDGVVVGSVFIELIFCSENFVEELRRKVVEFLGYFRVL